MGELALEARAFDSKPKALSKRLESIGSGGGGRRVGEQGRILSTLSGITKFYELIYIELPHQEAGMKFYKGRQRGPKAK